MSYTNSGSSDVLVFVAPSDAVLNSTNNIAPSKIEVHAKSAYDFFEKILNSPKCICAPMVLQSERAFRMQTRKYGVDLAYTPMISCDLFLSDEKERRQYLADIIPGHSGDLENIDGTSCANAVPSRDSIDNNHDRPLIAQFCANDAEKLLKAAKLVENHVDAIDLNLGCPQRQAREKNFGAWLMDQTDLVCVMSCGCAMLTVHGRERGYGKAGKFGPADWEQIRAVKSALKIPVIANGNINDTNDVNDCLKFTKADGVMSACGLLENPALFQTKKEEKSRRTLSEEAEIQFELASEYLSFCEQFPPQRNEMICDHLSILLEKQLENQKDVVYALTHPRYFENLHVAQFNQMLQFAEKKHFGKDIDEGETVKSICFGGGFEMNEDEYSGEFTLFDDDS